MHIKACTGSRERALTHDTHFATGRVTLVRKLETYEIKRRITRRLSGDEQAQCSTQRRGLSGSADRYWGFLHDPPKRCTKQMQEGRLSMPMNGTGLILLSIECTPVSGRHVSKGRLAAMVKFRCLTGCRII